jgi:hypothetical protein
MREDYATDGFETSIGGALYALVLCILGLMATGFGHGTYLPIAVFGAPLGVILGPLGFLGLLACLAWWPVVGFVLGASRGPGPAALLLALHAAAVLAMLMFGTPFERADEQWNYYRQAQAHVGPAIFTGWIVYIIGQAAAWSLVLVRWLSPASPEPSST